MRPLKLPPLKQKSFSPFIIILLALLFIQAGCGYHLVGKGSAVPSHVKTIAIPMLTNSSSEPNIQRDLTDAIRQSFINDHRLKVVSREKAHLVMEGNLSSYELRPVAFTNRDVATEYWVLLDVDIVVTDQVKKKQYLKHHYQTKWNYIAPESVVNAEEARQEAIREAFRDLANRLVSRVIDNF